MQQNNELVSYNQFNENLCYLEGRQLLCEGYLTESRVENGFGSTVDLSRKGRTWYSRAQSSEVKLELVPSQDLRKPMKVRVTVSAR